VNPFEEEFGPFPQFYIDAENDDGFTRRTAFSAREATRVVAYLVGIISGEEVADPFPDDGDLALSIPGEPGSLKKITLTRVDDLADFEKLPGPR
jgi:hypothetical protein